MEIIRTNGEILKLSVEEYKELYNESVEHKVKKVRNTKLLKLKDRIIKTISESDKVFTTKDLVKFGIRPGGSLSKMCEYLKKSKLIKVDKSGHVLKFTSAKRNINSNDNDKRIERGRFIFGRTSELIEEGLERKKAFNIANSEWNAKN